MINTYLARLLARLGLCLLIFSGFVFTHSLAAQDTLRTDSARIDSSNSKGNKMGNKGNKMANPNRDSLPPVKIDSAKIDSIKIDSAKIDSTKKADKPPAKIEKKPKAQPAKQALRWAIIPGGGQIYNRRYWKLPIVYAGLGGLGYWYVSSRSAYVCYRKAYSAAVDTDPTTTYICPRDPLASSRVLLLQRNYYRSQSEYALLGGLLFYALTMADAFVDAHLKTFDMSDDLSLKIRPKMQFAPQYSNISPIVQPQFALGISLYIRPKTNLVYQNYY